MTQKEDPWAAPQAAVADVEPGIATDRPPRIRLAMRWVWFSYWFSAALAVWALAKPSEELTAIDPDTDFAWTWTYFMAAFLLLWFAVVFWLIQKVGAGRNWARIVYLVLTVLAALSIPFELYWVATGKEPLLEALLTMVNYGAGFYSCYLLMTEKSSAWFEEMGRGA